MKDKKEVEELLLKHGASPLKKQEIQELLDKKFMAVCSSELVNLMELQRLLAKGADINTTNIWGSTCLMEAARKGDIKVSKFLVDNNVDVDKKNRYDRTALQIALDNGHKDVVSLLLGSDSNILYE